MIFRCYGWTVDQRVPKELIMCSTIPHAPVESYTDSPIGRPYTRCTKQVTDGLLDEISDDMDEEDDWSKL